MTVDYRRHYLFDGVFALGLFAGVISTFAFLLFVDLGDLALPENPVFVSTITGAVVGGTIGLLGQIFLIIDSRSARSNQQLETNLQLLYSLFQGVADIGSNLKGLAKHLDASKEQTKSTGAPLPVATIPLATQLRRIHFEKEEKINLLSLGLLESYNEIAILDARNNAHVDTFERFEKDREILMRLVSLSSTAGIIAVEFHPKDEQEVQGRMAVLNEQLENLSTLLERDCASIVKLMELLLTEISRYSGNDLGLEQTAIVRA